MKHYFIFCAFALLSFHIHAQDIVNLVMVGKNGITADVKEAHSFIVIKRYPGSYQRLEYRMYGPLQRLLTYSDSSLKMMQGDYYEYDAAGSMKLRGQYKDNLKDDEWYIYNDTGKIIRYEAYEKDVLVKTTNPDTLKKEEKTDKVSKLDREADFSKSSKGWINYLIKNIKTEVADKTANGGTVVVEFVVDTLGNCTNVHLYKSAQFILDEEAIRVIENSPQWKYPGVREGQKVKAYRRQPLSFAKPS